MDRVTCQQSRSLIDRKLGEFKAAYGLSKDEMDAIDAILELFHRIRTYEDTLQEQPSSPIQDNS